MSTTTKLELVAAVQDEYDLKAALAAIELPKSTWYYHQHQSKSYQDKYQQLRPLLEQIIVDHPSYGITRITQELQHSYDQPINHKVVQRLLQVWDLALMRQTQAPKPSHIRQVILAAGDRANLVAQLTEIEPFAVAYTDFTELLYAEGQQKAYLMPIIGHRCKLVYGWAVGPQANTEVALRAWSRAKQTFKRYDLPYRKMIVHHDQGSVYTGHVWLNQLLVTDKVQLSYALDGAKDNPWMESFNSRFKTEGRSLFLDAADLAQLRAVVATQIGYYNTQRRHSSLDYLTPLAYVKRVLATATA
jgi:transposase InsO family protein